MSTKGMKLGGVQTIEHVQLRCTEVGECWEWSMYANNFGQPQVYFDGRVQPVRRVVWQLINGMKTVPAGKLVTTTCGSPLCVAPEHLTVITQSTHMKRSREKGNELLRRSRIAVSKRAAMGIAPELVQAIRDNTTDAAPELAAMLGVCESTVYNVRSGRRHAPLAQSPWSGLMRGAQ